jgi:histidinol phosphatase-like enzyme (inositol monophosphatase family)
MDAFIALAHQLADAAGNVIRSYFGAHGNVEAKSDASPVTIADREAEAAMRALITQYCPDHAILGEEFGQTVISRQSSVVSKDAANKLETGDWRLQTRYTWVIDPIDGTKAFIAGRKEWGTLIALCEDGVPILGILDQPVTGERWVGMRGQPTSYNKSPSHVRMCMALSAASISTTSRNHFTPPQAKAFVALANQCDAVIENGDCYAYGLLARGERDIVIDAGLKPYDILALVPIIEGAGGIITTWDGASVMLSNYANVVAAGDSVLHADALGYLA